MHKLPAAGEALVPVELLPPGEAAGRPLPPVLAGRRRGDRLRRPGRRRRDDRAAAHAARRARGRASVRAAARLARHARRRAPPTARSSQAYLRAHEDAAVARRSARASTSTRCARSTPTTRARRQVMAGAPLLLDRLDAEDAEHFADGARAARRRRGRLRGRPDARARPGLLHAHGLRVHLRRARRPERRRRRRALRRARRAARRPADARLRLGGRHRADAARRRPRARAPEPAVDLFVAWTPEAARRARSSVVAEARARGHGRADGARRALAARASSSRPRRLGARYVARAAARTATS